MLPIPTKDYLPRNLRDLYDSSPEAIALCDKMDDLFTEWKDESIEIAYCKDPVRTPFQFLDEMNQYLEADFLAGDSELIKRKKLTEAIEFHKTRSTWTSNVKMICDNYTGKSATLVDPDTDEDDFIFIGTSDAYLTNTNYSIFYPTDRYLAYYYNIYDGDDAIEFYFTEDYFYAPVSGMKVKFFGSVLPPELNTTDYYYLYVEPMSIPFTRFCLTYADAMAGNYIAISDPGGLDLGIEIFDYADYPVPSMPFIGAGTEVENAGAIWIDLGYSPNEIFSLTDVIPGDETLPVAHEMDMSGIGINGYSSGMDIGPAEYLTSFTGIVDSLLISLQRYVPAYMRVFIVVPFGDYYKIYAEVV